MKSNKVQLFAHRGGRSWAPENTLCAFTKSLELGVDGIELDIQRCASGELLVFHDADLSRTTNGAGLLKDCQYDELLRLSAGAWFDPSFKAEKIPTLQEVLDLVNGECVLNIELKNLPYKYHSIEDELVEVMDSYKPLDKIIFSSFDHGAIRRMVDLRPEWNYALLMVGVPHDLKAYTESLGARYFHPEHDSIHSEAMEIAHSLDLKVLPWTVNTPRDWSRMLDLGVTGIITDKPDQLQTFLKQADALVADSKL